MADHTCPYNVGVTCPPNNRQCDACGWNPGYVRCPVTARPAVHPQQSPTRSKRVAKVDAKGKVVEVYSSTTMAAQENGISRTAVRERCLGKINRFSLDLCGCTFKYLD